MSIQSERVKKWRRATKERIVESMGGECQCCGYKTCINSLDLHHINPEEKDSGLADLRANHGRWALIVEELRKCILVCRNCHGEIHAGIRELPSEFKRFDEAYAEYRTMDKEIHYCPVCNGVRSSMNKTCSYKCSAVLKETVNWANHDLKKLFVDEKKTQTEIAVIVGVSDVAVSKRLKKLGLK